MATFDDFTLTFSLDERLIIDFLLKQGGAKTTREIKNHLKVMQKYVFQDSVVLAARGVLPSKNKQLYFPPAHETLKKILAELKKKGVVGEETVSYTRRGFKTVMSWWKISPAFARYWFDKRKELFKELEKIEPKKRKLAYPRHYLEFFDLEEILENVWKENSPRGEDS